MHFAVVLLKVLLSSLYWNESLTLTLTQIAKVIVVPIFEQALFLKWWRLRHRKFPRTCTSELARRLARCYSDMGIHAGVLGVPFPKP